VALIALVSAHRPQTAAHNLLCFTVEAMIAATPEDPA
jgi:hypothetical protein